MVIVSELRTSNMASLKYGNSLMNWYMANIIFPEVLCAVENMAMLAPGIMYMYAAQNIATDTVLPNRLGQTMNVSAQWASKANILNILS